MSLVGSLEDLGLGDILQIISLSRKSGMLVLRADEGEGQIVFCEGSIATALCKGGPSDLRELLSRRGSVGGADLESAAVTARDEGRSLEEVLVERGLASAEELEGLRRDHVESVVLSMFAWDAGEFSFEISDLPSEVEGDLRVTPGINPQFLALEGTRFRDEGQRDAAAPEAGLLEAEILGESGETDDDLEDQAFDLDAAFAPHHAEAGAPAEAPRDEPAAAPEEPQPAAAPEQAQPAPAPEPQEPQPAPELGPQPAPVAPGAAPAAGAVAAARPGPPAASPLPEEAGTLARPVVVVDGDLACLEWIKEALVDVAPQVHIFQRSDHAMNRIRQYLARAQRPLVLLAVDAPADPLSGARDAGEIVRRLKAQSERLPILLLAEEAGEEAASLPAGADGLAFKPTPTELADARCVKERESLAVQLREAVLARGGAPPQPQADSESPERLPPATLSRLKLVTERLRDRQASGEVLSIVMRFALETFSRVALFMVRGDFAHGLAQLELARGGGPDNAGLRQVALPVREPGWFRRVLDARTPHRAAPSDAGDQRLAVLLGNTIPEEAYIAPIESGDQVVALLYGDNLPGRELIGDTGALEVVLQQAGLVLDRACLERILEQTEGP